MPSNITFNPNNTTNISGSFVTQTGGYVQGVFLDDPAVRYQLKGGVVDTNAATPLWGGLPVLLSIPLANAGAAGPVIDPATTYAQINGWSVFNQATAGIITPSSNVPLYAGGTSLNFFETGSNARIAVPILSSLANTLLGQSISTQVSWDFTLNQITTFSVTALPVVIEEISPNGKTVSYSSVTGFANWTTGPVAIIRI